MDLYIYENGNRNSEYCYLIDKNMKLGVYEYVGLEKEEVLDDGKLTRRMYKLFYRRRKSRWAVSI
ncbi:hypothetical protein AC625_08605 [Peribacillus loiseleuriae]|uniref:Uncharacterized protein n=1 Tax=Peribacillus loiseleuriae TaxID=1679170 RepID=A0A0K9GSC9_9BACI|nr:hypothetical protein AC625_08605 [Peribacillus loiseleuriae]